MPQIGNQYVYVVCPSIHFVTPIKLSVMPMAKPASKAINNLAQDGSLLVRRLDTLRSSTGGKRRNPLQVGTRLPQ